MEGCNLCCGVKGIKGVRTCRYRTIVESVLRRSTPSSRSFLTWFSLMTVRLTLHCYHCYFIVIHDWSDVSSHSWSELCIVVVVVFFFLRDCSVSARCKWNHRDLTKALDSLQPSCFQTYDLQISASLRAPGQSAGPTRWQICKSVHSIHFTPLIRGQLKQMLLGVYNEVAVLRRLAWLDKWTLIDLSLVSIDSILHWKTPKQMGV